VTCPMGLGQESKRPRIELFTSGSQRAFAAKAKGRREVKKKMRERATADGCLQAKRVWQKQQKDKRRHCAATSTTKARANEPALTLERARARTRLAEISLSR
jgi:hypothetical protein